MAKEFKIELNAAPQMAERVAPDPEPTPAAQEEQPTRHRKLKSEEFRKYPTTIMLRDNVKAAGMEKAYKSGLSFSEYIQRLIVDDVNR